MSVSFSRLFQAKPAQKRHFWRALRGAVSGQLPSRGVCCFKKKKREKRKKGKNLDFFIAQEECDRFRVAPLPCVEGKATEWPCKSAAWRGGRSCFLLRLRLRHPHSPCRWRRPTPGRSPRWARLRLCCTHFCCLFQRPAARGCPRTSHGIDHCGDRGSEQGQMWTEGVLSRARGACLVSVLRLLRPHVCGARFPGRAACFRCGEALALQRTPARDALKSPTSLGST